MNYRTDEERRADWIAERAYAIQQDEPELTDDEAMRVAQVECDGEIA